MTAWHRSKRADLSLRASGLLLFGREYPLIKVPGQRAGFADVRPVVELRGLCNACAA